MSTALSIATTLAHGPQVAIRGTKISVSNWLKAQFSSLFEVSLAAELQSMDHPDFAEGYQPLWKNGSRTGSRKALTTGLRTKQKPRVQPSRV